jgi:DNA-binding response OmpR family regulator
MHESPEDLPASTAMSGALDRTSADLVLIVDDVPDNLSVLHDALDESGYTVLIATNGESAIQRAAQALPDIVLLDAVMPGMDGFEVARQLKARPDTAHIPIVFMTGLTDTEHVVHAFQAGGVDYVTKPIRPREVLARIAVHMQGARQARQARNALDAFGHAMIAVRISNSRLVWQTPLARTLLHGYFDTPFGVADVPQVPPAVLAWLTIQSALAEQGGEPKPLTQVRGAAPAGAEPARSAPATKTGWWSCARCPTPPIVEAMMAAFKLTLREAEVLYWVVKGKTNRDIGDILGSSPADGEEAPRACLRKARGRDADGSGPPGDEQGRALRRHLENHCEENRGSRLRRETRPLSARPVPLSPRKARRTAARPSPCPPTAPSRRSPWPSSSRPSRRLHARPGAAGAPPAGAASRRPASCRRRASAACRAPCALP